MFMAFVWGFVDFIKADAKGTFKTLYRPINIQAAVVVKDSANEFNTEYFSRTALPEDYSTENTKRTTSKTTEPDMAIMDSVKAIEKLVKNGLPKKPKKLLLRSFSRSSLDIPMDQIKLSDSISITIDSAVKSN